jgi:hypothetical protein
LKLCKKKSCQALHLSRVHLQYFEDKSKKLSNFAQNFISHFAKSMPSLHIFQDKFVGAMPYITTTTCIVVVVLQYHSFLGWATGLEMFSQAHNTLLCQSDVVFSFHESNTNYTHKINLIKFYIITVFYS